MNPIRTVLLVVLVALGLAIVPTSSGAQSLPAPKPPPANTPTSPNGSAVIAARQSGQSSAAALAAVTLQNVYTDRNFSSYWYPGRVPGYVSLNWRLKVEQTSDLVGYFYGHHFKHLNNTAGTGGYAGLQTILVTNGLNTGRGAIFSIFGATGCTAGGGATCVSGSEPGGAFKSIHRPYTWITGRSYQFNLVALRNAAGQFNGQVNVTLVDTVTGASTLLGGIVVPIPWGLLDDDMIEFTEFYSQSETCAVPQTFVVWEQYTVVFPTYPPQQRYATPQYGGSSSSRLQSGTSCTNSFWQALDGGQLAWKHWIGT